jgi:hypothetical protein
MNPFLLFWRGLFGKKEDKPENWGPYRKAWEAARKEGKAGFEAGKPWIQIDEEPRGCCYIGCLFDEMKDQDMPCRICAKKWHGEAFKPGESFFWPSNEPLPK